MLKNIAFNLIKFLIEFIKFFSIMYVALRLELQDRRKIILYSSLSILLCIVISMFEVSSMIPTAAYICLVYTILILKGKRKTICGITVYSGICIADILIASIYILLSEEGNLKQLSDNKAANLISNSGTILLIGIIIGVCLLYRKNKNYNANINIFYLLLIIAGEISIGGFITAFQFMSEYNKVLAVMLCLGGVIFLIISVMMMVNYISKNHYKEIADINDRLLKSKENYYTMLLQKDKDTAKFRHDISNHLNCMYILFDKGKYDELREYFQEIGASLDELHSQIQTGNDMVSAILNDTAKNFPMVHCETNGKMPNDIKICNMDICTIFYNLLDNAFTAANSSEKKFVKIFFKTIGCNLFCQIINSVDHDITIINNSLTTEKGDKIKHGFGTKNVTSCIEKSGGNIVYNCDNNIFTAELIIPMM